MDDNATRSIGNAADNFKRNSFSSSLSEQDIKILQAKYSVMRDPLLMHDPSADVGFEDFIHSAEARKSLETLAGSETSSSSIRQGLKKATANLKKHFRKS